MSETMTSGRSSLAAASRAHWAQAGTWLGVLPRWNVCTQLLGAITFMVAAFLLIDMPRLKRLRDNGPKVFQIETTLNTDTFPQPFEFLSKREWEWNAKDRALYLGTAKSVAKLPARTARKIFHGIEAPHQMTSIQCGEVEAVHKVTTQHVYDQQLVEVEGQTDILTMGIPYICPYNVNSIMNPILVMCLGLGYFFNMYRGRPLVRGALGDFDVKLATGGTQLALGALLAPPLERFDLVVDLGAPRLLQQAMPPLGYYAPGPDAEARATLADVLPEVRGEFENFKLTWPGDFALAGRLLASARLKYSRAFASSPYSR